MAEKIKSKGIQKDAETLQEEKLEKLKRLQELESHLAAASQEETTVTESANKESQISEASETADSDQLVSAGERQIASIDAQMDAVEKQIASEMKSMSARSNVSDAQIEQDLLSLENEVAAETVSEIVKSSYEKLVDIHPWLEQPQYGFMYGLPPDPKKKKKDFESWQEEWSQVLLDYARVAVMHIVYPKNLLTEPPFNKFQDRTKSVELLSTTLVEKKIAAWLDKKREILRVYWKSLEEWANILVDWARDTGKTEPIIMAELRESEKEFASLPDDDIKKIFKIIEKRNDGQIVPMDNGEWAIKIKMD